MCVGQQTSKFHKDFKQTEKTETWRFTHPCIEHLVPETAVKLLWIGLWNITNTWSKSHWKDTNSHSSFNLPTDIWNERTSRLVELESHMSIKSQAEVIVEDIQRKLRHRDTHINTAVVWLEQTVMSVSTFYRCAWTWFTGTQLADVSSQPANVCYCVFQRRISIKTSAAAASADKQLRFAQLSCSRRCAMTNTPPCNLSSVIIKFSYSEYLSELHSAEVDVEMECLVLTVWR